MLRPVSLPIGRVSPCITGTGRPSSIRVVQGQSGEAVRIVTVDRVVQREQTIPLVDDHNEHFVGVVVAPGSVQGS